MARGTASSSTGQAPAAQSVGSGLRIATIVALAVLAVLAFFSMWEGQSSKPFRPVQRTPDQTPSHSEPSAAPTPPAAPTPSPHPHDKAALARAAQAAVSAGHCKPGADVTGAFTPAADIFQAPSSCSSHGQAAGPACAPESCAETAASPIDPVSGLPNHVLKPSCITTSRCPALKPWPAALISLCSDDRLWFGCLQRLPPPADPATVPDVEFHYRPSSLETKYINMVNNEPNGQPRSVCALQNQLYDEVKMWVDIAESRWENGVEGWKAFDAAAKADGSPYSAMELVIKAPASASTTSSSSSEVAKAAPGTVLARTKVPLEPLVGIMRHPFAGKHHNADMDSFCKGDKEKPRSLWEWSYIATEAAHDPTFRMRYPGRKVLVDLGGTTWGVRDKNTIDLSKADSRTYADMFGSAGIEFDAVFMWEGNDKDHSVQRFIDTRKTYGEEGLDKYCYALRYASPLPGRLDNAVEMLAQLWRPGDYFVFKLDIDNRPVEEDFIKIIADTSCPHIVQELIFEQHHNLPELGKGYWGTEPDLMAMTHSMSLQRFVQLREMGIRSHAWV